MTNRSSVMTVAVVTFSMLGLAGCHHGSRCCRSPFTSGCTSGCGASSYASPVVQPYSAVTPLPQPPIPAGDPQATGSWQPAPGIEPHVTEIRPIPVPTPNGRTDGARLSPPENSQIEQIREPPIVRPDRIAKPEADEFPADIPQFNLVQDKVAAGLQPSGEGFDWLKKRGYHAVLHVRGAGEDEKAARENVERHGLKYLSIEVTPRSLNRELASKFSTTIADKDQHPLFVYDRKGMLAGSLWYLHFRLADKRSESEARTKAARLGLKEETVGEYAELWLAINQVLRGI